MSSPRSRSGGSADLDRVQAEEQVLAEAARRRPPRGGRRWSPRGSARPPCRVREEPSALELSGLEDPQELGLLARGHVGDLVEEERAAVGELEASDAVRARVGEGALDVAEELALEDALGDAAGVQRHERPRGAARGGVEGARDDALAGPVLPDDEDVRVGGPDALDHLEHRAHRRRLRDHLRLAVAGAGSGSRPRAAARWRSARPSAIWVRSVVSRRVLSHGFWTKSRAPRRIASTARSTVPQAVMTMTGSVGSSSLDPREQVEPLLPRRRVARVVQVDQHRVEVARLERRRARRPASDAVSHSKPFALEQQAQGLEHVALVVGDQDPVGRGGVVCFTVRERATAEAGTGGFHGVNLTRISHSVRRAAIGSSRVARRAGTQQAASATTHSTAAMAAYVSGSLGPTS